MDESEIESAIDHILAQGCRINDCQDRYNALLEAGERVVPHILSALLRCADGEGEGRWWDGAGTLCRVLSVLKTEESKDALLTVLETDSRIVEFDRVRHQAAEELVAFRDPGIIPKLLAAAKTAHAPVLSIKKAIEALGGSMPSDPSVILAEVSRMPFEDRIEHFRKYRDLVDKWEGVQRRSYYWWIGTGVASTQGEEAALPFYAASLEADPSPDAAAWTIFRDIPRTREMAEKLARQYPLQGVGGKPPVYRQPLKRPETERPPAILKGIRSEKTKSTSVRKFRVWGWVLTVVGAFLLSSVLAYLPKKDPNFELYNVDVRALKKRLGSHKTAVDQIMQNALGKGAAEVSAVDGPSLVSALNSVLQMPEFYATAPTESLKLDTETRQLLQKAQTAGGGGRSLDKMGMAKLNRSLLFAIYSRELNTNTSMILLVTMVSTPILAFGISLLLRARRIRKKALS